MSEKKLLKNCPFCGGNHVISTWNNFRPALLCGGCGATMIVPMDIRGGDYKEELITKWNTRVPMQKIVERLNNNFRKVQNDEDLEWNRAIYKTIEIVKEEGGLND
jgi:Lar family restriction alleviation protein